MKELNDQLLKQVDDL
jgi:hypothetical protein